MKQNITIPLEEPEGLEDYSAKDHNIMQIRVGAHGEWHSSPEWIVDLSLSRDAMIGLATALLRAAHDNSNQSTFVEMRPAEIDCAVERFGVFVHPKSCRLNLLQREFGDIETVLRHNV